MFLYVVNLEQPPESTSHGMGLTLRRERTTQMHLYFGIGRCILLGKLDPYPGLSISLSSSRRNPDHSPCYRNFFWLIHKGKQHENLITNAIPLIRRDENPPVIEKGHISGIQDSLVFNR